LVADLQPMIAEILASRAFHRFLTRDRIAIIKSCLSPTLIPCGLQRFFCEIKAREKILLQLKTVYICSSKKIQKT